MFQLERGGGIEGKNLLAIVCSAQHFTQLYAV